MQEQYMEDQLSVLDIAKEGAGALLNPFYAAQYDPNFWSPNSYNGIKIGSGVFDPNGRINKGIKSAWNWGRQKVSGYSASDIRKGKAATRAGRIKYNKPISGGWINSPAAGASSKIADANWLNRQTTGVLKHFHYTDGYLGINMGRTFDFTGYKASGWYSRMQGMIDNSKDVTKKEIEYIESNTR